MFYIIPFSVTAVFSILCYPKVVYLNKRILKVKSFYAINLVFKYRINSFKFIKSVLPILMYFNVKVFSMTQTYVGFKILEYYYNKSYNDFQDINNSNKSKFTTKKDVNITTESNKKDKELSKEDLGYFYFKLVDKI